MTDYRQRNIAQNHRGLFLKNTLRKSREKRMESMHCPGKKYCKDTGFVVPCIYKRVLCCCRETGRISCLIQKMHQATVCGVTPRSGFVWFDARNRRPQAELLRRICVAYE